MSYPERRKPRQKSYDLVGQKIHKLRVKEKAHRDKRHNQIWKCLCDCGKICFIPTSLFGRQQSCGCLDLPGNPKRHSWKPNRNRLSFGTAAKNRLLRNYKRSARARALDWNLTNRETDLLFQGLCYYCGAEPNQSIVADSRRVNSYVGCYVYNGIDRLDSKKGYAVDNCVSCCGICNTMKMDRPVGEFLNHVKKIHDLHMRLART